MAILPPLRFRELNLMRSPVPDRPGLLIRDNFGYSDATIIIPPGLVPALEFFNGQSTDLDLRQFLVQLTGDLDVGGLLDHIHGALSEAGFLENETYEQIRDARQQAFADSPHRTPSHAGSAYPDEIPELEATFERYFAGAGDPRPDLTAIAAPHVSPEGGFACYRDAYAALPAALGNRTFVILGTSHYGEPDRFGLTRKGFETPLGVAPTDGALVDSLVRAAPSSVLLEDYCHAVEHSIELQVLFLQRRYGPDVRIVPILCGPFAASIYSGTGQPPETNEHVRRFFGVLGELAAAQDRLAWVLGVDMAHKGARYNEDLTARAGQDEMQEVERRDRLRIEAMLRGDAQGFWAQVQENQDDLNWCGSSPIYTYLKVQPQARGELFNYQQWNIDEASVVSFAAAGFR